MHTSRQRCGTPLTSKPLTSGKPHTSYLKKNKSDTLGSLALPPLPTVAQPASASIASSSIPPPPTFFFFLPFGPSPATQQANKGSVGFKTQVAQVTEVCPPTSCKRARARQREREECVRRRSKRRRCFLAYCIPACSISLHDFVCSISLHAFVCLLSRFTCYSITSAKQASKAGPAGGGVAADALRSRRTAPLQRSTAMGVDVEG